MDLDIPYHLAVDISHKAVEEYFITSIWCEFGYTSYHEISARYMNQYIHFDSAYLHRVQAYQLNILRIVINSHRLQIINHILLLTRSSERETNRKRTDPKLGKWARKTLFPTLLPFIVGSVNRCSRWLLAVCQLDRHQFPRHRRHLTSSRKEHRHEHWAGRKTFVQKAIVVTNKFPHVVVNASPNDPLLNIVT